MPVKISIIIPVYNAERYISRCIESLKEQSLQELEFIFVDDCSVDNSMDAVHEWAHMDSRVKIIRNDNNLGEGTSRNIGLEAARGTYLNTIDPDDWMAPDFYELLYAKAAETSADIVKGTRIKIDEESFEEVLPRSTLNEKIKVSLGADKPLYVGLYFEHQTIIFKRDLLDANTRYGASGNACDTTFLLRLCSKTESFAMEEGAIYYYFQRHGAATTEYTLKRSENELISFTEQIDFFYQAGHSYKNAYDYCKNNYCTYASRFCHAYADGKISELEKVRYIEDLKEQARRILSKFKGCEPTPEMSVLVDESILLTSILSDDLYICKNEASDWIKILADSNGKKRKNLSLRFCKLLVNYIRDRKKSGATLMAIRGEVSEIISCIDQVENKRQIYAVISRPVIVRFVSHPIGTVKLAGKFLKK